MHLSQQPPMGQGPQRYGPYGMMPPPQQQQQPGPASMNPEAHVFVPTLNMVRLSLVFNLALDLTFPETGFSVNKLILLSLTCIFCFLVMIGCSSHF